MFYIVLFSLRLSRLVSCLHLLWVESPQLFVYLTNHVYCIPFTLVVYCLCDVSALWSGSEGIQVMLGC